jgi:hypothetical protein
LSENYDHYLTTQETAQVLGVGRRTLARYKSQDKITPITINNKDLYAPEEVARFNASADSVVDKLRKQHAYNSARLAELEVRLASMEALLDVRSVQKVSHKDVKYKDLHNALDDVCRKGASGWNMHSIEDLLRDVSRLDDRLLRKLGKTVVTALELASLHASRLDEQRSMLLVCRAERLLEHVTCVQD